MFETIGMLCVYALIIFGAIVVFGIPTYIFINCGPNILRAIKQTIKWNLNKFKDDDIFKD